MVVCKPVDRARPLTPKRDEPPVPQEAQLVTDSRLTDACNRREIAHAELLVDQGLEDTETRPVGEGGEDGRRPVDPFIVSQ